MIRETDEVPDEQELEAHYMYMVNTREVLTAADDYLVPTYDIEPLEKVHTDDDYRKADQNTEESEDERVLLASLIANLKLDVDKNKKIEKQLKKANTFVTQELEKYKLDLKYCKSDLERYKLFQTNQKDKEAAELKCKEAFDLLDSNTHKTSNIQKQKLT
ncbi:hypothetical protein Tco_1321105 [Tanacetum coccineum]